jgi:hypothetical protein
MIFNHDQTHSSDHVHDAKQEKVDQPIFKDGMGLLAKSPLSPCLGTCRPITYEMTIKKAVSVEFRFNWKVTEGSVIAPGSFTPVECI